MSHRELCILRHAKSDWEQGCSDFERPLNARGRRDAANMGQWLHTQSFHPDAIYSSTAQRAAETARAVCTGLSMSSEIISWEERLYLASLDSLLQVIADIPVTQQRVLLIGHNPGLEDLLAFLSPDTDQYVQRGKLLTTATFARLNISDSWMQLKRQGARLEQFVRPCDLTSVDT